MNRGWRLAAKWAYLNVGCSWLAFAAALPASAREAQITRGSTVFQDPAPAGLGIGCDPDELFVAMKLTDAEGDNVQTTRIKPLNASGFVGIVSVFATDIATGKKEKWDLSCAPNAYPEVKFGYYPGSFRFKPDPRVKLTATCNTHMNMMSYFYAQTNREWRIAHEVCREFLSQIVEHLWVLEEDSVLVHVDRDETITLPFPPKARTPGVEVP